MTSELALAISLAFLIVIETSAADRAIESLTPSPTIAVIPFWLKTNSFLSSGFTSYL